MTPRDAIIVRNLFDAGVSVETIASAFWHSRHEVEAVIRNRQKSTKHPAKRRQETGHKWETLGDDRSIHGGGK